MELKQRGCPSYGTLKKTGVVDLYWFKQGCDPGAPLTYFNDGGVRRIFLGLTLWPKGIFLGHENNTGTFLGIVFFISSNQQ